MSNLGLLTRNHPQLKHCGFFWHSAGPGGLARPHNLMGGVSGTSTGATRDNATPVISPAVRLAPGEMEFGPLAGYFPRNGREITVLLRGRFFSSGAIGVYASALPSGSEGGFFFSDVEGFFSNVGIGFGLKTGGAALQTWAGNGYAFPYGTDGILGATWAPGYDRPRLFWNGVRIDSQLIQGDINADWRPFSSAPNLMLGNQGLMDEFGHCELRWAMVFDRALSGSQQAAFLDEAAWEFTADEAVLFEGTPSYRTTARAGQTLFVVGPVTYATGGDASAAVGGDVVTAPPVGSGAYRTTARVGQRYLPGLPELVSYRTTARVGQTVSVASPILYRTTAGAGQRAVGRIDGRSDLLGTFRYRR